MNHEQTKVIQELREVGYKVIVWGKPDQEKVKAQELIASETISISWNVEDVLEVCPQLSREEAIEVLQLADAKHDACVGICWETFEVYADIINE